MFKINRSSAELSIAAQNQLPKSIVLSVLLGLVSFAAHSETNIGRVSFKPVDIERVVCRVKNEPYQSSAFAWAVSNIDGSFRVGYFSGFSIKALQLKASYYYRRDDGHSAGYEFPDVRLGVMKDPTYQIEGQPDDMGLTVIIRDEGNLTGTNSNGNRYVEVEGTGMLRFFKAPLVCTLNLKP